MNVKANILHREVVLQINQPDSQSRIQLIITYSSRRELINEIFLFTDNIIY